MAVEKGRALTATREIDLSRLVRMQLQPKPREDLAQPSLGVARTRLSRFIQPSQRPTVPSPRQRSLAGARTESGKDPALTVINFVSGCVSM
jgi:hypothetical protein